MRSGYFRHLSSRGRVNAGPQGRREFQKGRSKAKASPMAREEHKRHNQRGMTGPEKRRLERNFAAHSPSVEGTINELS